MPNPSSISVEERQVAGTHLGGTSGAQPEWTWLTPDEAVEIARTWLEKYSK